MLETSDHTPSCENAPGLQAWGPLANRVVQLSKAYPPIATRLFFAPPAAFHSYVIAVCYWHTDTDEARFASHLYETNPRELIFSAFAAPAPSLFRALKRAGKHAQTTEFYVRLNLLLSYAEIAEEILQVKEITPVVVDFFYKVQARRLDTLVVAAHQHLEHKFSRALGLHDVLQVCRRFDIVPANEIAAAAIKRSAGRMNDLISKWLENCECPFILEGLPSQLTQIKNGKEMTSIARRFKNCLINARFKIELASGKRIFIVYKEGDGDSSVEAVATLVAELYQVWWIDECNLISRHAASPAVRERIVQLLGQAGIEVAMRGFQDAWDELSSGSATPRIEDLWDMTWANQD